MSSGPDALMPVFVRDVGRRAQAIEQLFLALRNEADLERRDDLLGRLAQEAHALKGIACLLGLEQTNGLAAGLERLIAGVGSGRAEVDEEMLDVIGTALDSLGPLAAEESQAVAKAAAPAARTVLVIEDTESNQKLLEFALADRGDVEVVATGEGRRGLELAARLQPDVVILDLGLPDLGGEYVLRGLREDARTRHIPVVVLSAEASPSSAERVLASGATACLTKPLDLEQFLALLGRLWSPGAPACNAELGGVEALTGAPA